MHSDILRRLFLAIAGTITLAGAVAAAPPSAAALSAGWSEALAGAKIVKSELAASDYQYPLIGNGGLSLMPGPDGFTDMQPQNAPYAPVIGSASWWNESTARVLPFSLSGGYTTNTGTSRGTIESFEQTLDVRSGALTSKLQLAPLAGEAPGSDGFSSTRTEFVTPAGVLVIQIEDSVSHEFTVGVAPQQGFGATYAETATGLTATSSGGDAQALGLVVGASGEGVSVDAAAGTVSAMVGPGEPATFFLAADGIGGSGTSSASAAAAVAAAQAAGYTASQTANSEFWSSFWGASSIEVPDSKLMTWYIRGQYYLAALTANAQVPPGVSGPTGEYNGDPDLEYDAIYDDLALLTANEPAVSKAWANWVEGDLPAAEALAPYYTYNGSPTPGAAKYPWLADYEGAEDSQFGASPVQNDWEAYPSANAAMVDLFQAQYTNDPARLARAEHLLEEVTRYQLDNSARDPELGDELVSQKFEGLVFGLSGYVTGSAGDQAALQWSLREAAALGVGPSEWAQDAREVYLPTALDSARGQDVVTGYIGQVPSISDEPYVTALPLYFYRDIGAESPLAQPTVADLGGSPVLGDTLMIGNTAVAADIDEDGTEALRLLDYMVDSTNASDPATADLWDETYFSEGGDCSLPNADCASGPSTTPNMSGHSSFDQGLQYMLFDGESSSSITAFPALPPAWEQHGAAFTDLLANGGIEVSGTYNESRTSVTLRNDGASAATRTLSMPIPAEAKRLGLVGDANVEAILHGRFAKLAVTIQPGETRTVTVEALARGSWQTVDDADPRITYSEGWTARSGVSGAIDGTEHESSGSGATANLTFEGTAVRVIGDCGPDQGQVGVVIDGKLRGYYDTWCDAQTPRQVIFEADDLAPGPHEIELESSSLQDVQSTGDSFPLDAIQYGEFGIASVESPSGAMTMTSHGSAAGGAGEGQQAGSEGPPRNTVGGSTRSRRPNASVVTLGRTARGVRVRVRCKGSAGQMCTVAGRLSIAETLFPSEHGSLFSAGLMAGGGPRPGHRELHVSAKRIRIRAGHSASLSMLLDRAGRRLLSRRGRPRVSVLVRQAVPGRKARRLLYQVVELRSAKGQGTRSRRH